MDVNPSIIDVLGLDMVFFVLLLTSVFEVIVLFIGILMRYILLVATVENGSTAPTLEAGDRVLMIRH